MYSIFKEVPPLIQRGALTLRYILETDAPSYFEMMSDEENARFMTPTLHKALQDSTANIHHMQNQYQIGTGIFLAVALSEDNRMIGLVGVNKIDETKQTGRVSYLINKCFWGRGYGPLAANLLIDYIFENTPITRLEATIKPDNTNSIKCIVKAGFQLERIIDNYVSSAKEDTSKVRLLYVREKKEGK